MKPYYAEEAYTKNRLREKEKELKRWKDKWEEQVLMLQKALIAFPAQTVSFVGMGNFNSDR
ncbi:11766_t:CDS:2 [Paraglomus brasilianum]|uniref:11766_t:CDS:1 n=1 Tax=Paraglomus brasilianum TaxID=144538 RepID=A0A9N9BYE0_9GLOM|nr:11766_t:CDS:2 [Paraglomus brasilianum]